MAMREFISKVTLLDMEGKPFYVYERRLNTRAPEDWSKRPALVLESVPWYLGITPRVRKELGGLTVAYYEPIDPLT